MLKILVTGASGFVGQNLLAFYKGKANVTTYDRKNILEVNTDAIVHLAGKAHDLKKVSVPGSYYEANTRLTQTVFDAFLKSEAKVFITISSVKAVADHVDKVLTEQDIPGPATHYGKSKRKAEEYIVSQAIPAGKRFYILRPCMIHGPHNKGNLSLLYNIVSKRIPWPLGAFNNQRSYCSIDNLCFIIDEMIRREDIPSGIYNVADDEPLSTNEVIRLIAQSKSRSASIIRVPKVVISILAKTGDFLRLPFNVERLEKLTENYVVSNAKIKSALGKPLPVSVRDGLLRTFRSFA